MPKFILVTEDFPGNENFVCNDDGCSYTDDLLEALVFDSADEAQRERLDDEKVAELKSDDENGWFYEVQA